MSWIETVWLRAKMVYCTSFSRWLFTYNDDSRPLLVNDMTFDWHAGGVPKKAGRAEYALDGNGWTIKRGVSCNEFSADRERMITLYFDSIVENLGEISFEMDGYGRLIGARGPSVDVKIEYDYQNRLISYRNGVVSHLLSWLSARFLPFSFSSVFSFCISYIPIFKVSYSLYYALPHLPRLVSHFQSSSDSSATSILYTEEGVAFAMSRDGYRYALAVDDEGSLR